LKNILVEESCKWKHKYIPGLYLTANCDNELPLDVELYQSLQQSFGSLNVMIFESGNVDP
jgi:hypothetical protein